jgi:hypothetical protein
MAYFTLTRAATAESRKDRPGFFSALPDVDPARPERQQAVNLLIAIGGAGGDVQVHAVLDGLGIGDRHEAHADRAGPVPGRG